MLNLRRIGRRIWQYLGSLHRAVLTTLVASVLEFTLWLILGVAGSLINQQQIPAALVAYFADNFGNLVIGVATTAYVIFTYYLLKGSEAMWRRAAQPFVVVRRWERSAVTAEHRAADSEHLGQEISRRIQRILPGARIEAVLAERYLNIEIVNAWDTPIAWLRLQASATGVIAEEAPFRVGNEADLRGLNLPREGSLLITLLDLGEIPINAAVTVRIESIRYGPVEPGVEIREFRGQDHYETTGAANVYSRIEAGPAIEGEAR